MGVFGSGGLAALLLEPARPVPHILLRVVQVTLLPLGETSLRAVLIAGISRVPVSGLAQGSPRTGLALIRPGWIVSASSSGGMMVRAVAPVRGIRVRRPAVGSQQGSGGLTFRNGGAHYSRFLD